MRDCGKRSPSPVRRRRRSSRISPEGVWIRAMSCGITSSHVLMCTSANPSSRASFTSRRAPYLNHSVRMRRMSCSTFSLPLVDRFRETDRKNPRTAGTRCARTRRPAWSRRSRRCSANPASSPGTGTVADGRGSPPRSSNFTAW